MICSPPRKTARKPRWKRYRISRCRSCTHFLTSRFSRGNKDWARVASAIEIPDGFSPDRNTAFVVDRCSSGLTDLFVTEARHAFIVCTHIDKKHIHNHIIWNSTTLDCKKKFRDFFRSGRAVRRLSDTICIENGYSIVENPKHHGKHYGQWLGSKPPSHRDQLRGLIDNALTQKPTDLDALLVLLQEAGVTVKCRGKGISLQAPGRKGFIRLDTRSMGQESRT